MATPKTGKMEETIIFCNFMAYIHGISSKYSRLKLEVVKEAQDRHRQAQIDVLVIFKNGRLLDHRA